MTKFFIPAVILFLTISGCIEKQVQETQKKMPIGLPETDKLTQFFAACNEDIKKAVQVIADNKMEGSLTHLKKMDMEGRKYYLLERENLTQMIKSVTEGTYSDLILINNKGTIIYTMINDDIFGKNVKYQLKGTGLHNCFNNSLSKNIYIEDVSMFPNEKGTPKLFVSFPDKRDNTLKGVFIIQIDVEIIELLLEKQISIIGLDGKYKIDKNRDNILKPYEYYDKLDIANIGNIKKQEFNIENNRYFYFPFNFNNISWILISKQ